MNLKRWTWIVFHPRATAKLLNEQDQIIRDLVTDIHKRVWDRPTGLTDMIHAVQETRTQGFNAGVAAARRKDEQPSKSE